MDEIPKEKRMDLAIEAFYKGLHPSKTDCAKAFDIPPRTFMDCLKGAISREETAANC